MEIKGIYDAYHLHSGKIRNRQTQKPDESAFIKKSTGNVDTVAISPQASFQSKIESAMEQYSISAQKNTLVSSERIAQLKLKYQGDACPVSGSEIASAILQKICGIISQEVDNG